MHPETLSEKTGIVFAKIASVARPFYLAGGTALALEFGHRISIDLDFFCINDFSTQEISDKLKTMGHFEVDDQSKDTLNGSLDGVKVSFFKYPNRLLFPTIEYMGIFLADERDIAAMKIEAISGRGSKKDFIDMFFLLKKYKLDEILKLFNDKYNEYNYNSLHILKSLTYFDDADEDLDPVYINPISWNEVKNIIKNTVNEYLKSQIN